MSSPYAPPQEPSPIESPAQSEKRMNIVAAVAVGAALLIGGTIVAVSLSDGEVDGTRFDRSQTAGRRASDEPDRASSTEQSSQADLTDFQSIDTETWNNIARDPESAAGEEIIVFAEVTQYDAATGNEMFLANVGSVQPVAEWELETNTVISGDADTLNAVAFGDVVRVHAEVDGTIEYETQIGGSTVAPALRAVSVERVGYLDITEDAELGDPTWTDYSGVEIPITVTNTSDKRTSLLVHLVAESPDGSMQVGTTSALVENLDPGQSASTETWFYEDIPRDAVFRVVAVERMG